MALWIGFRNEKNKNLFQLHLGKCHINKAILIHFLLNYPVFNLIKWKFRNVEP